MTKVILTAQVKNGDTWDKAFQTHGDFFRSQGRATSPIQYTRTGNEVALCSEVPDVDAYRKMVDSPETVAAMAQDGVKRETVKLFVLEKELRF